MKELLKETINRFALPVLAASCIGLGGTIYASLQEIGDLKTRLVKIEHQLEGHEKALDRNFARHEQTVNEISHRTDDQEKRLTRLEALVTQTQELLAEIRADMKILLYGKKQQ